MLSNLQTYDVSKTKAEAVRLSNIKVRQLEKSIKKTGEELALEIKSKNKATGGLFKWVENTLNCYEIFKDVEPKRKMAKALKEQKAEAEKDLA